MPVPIVIPEWPDDEWDFSHEWKEVVEDQRPGGSSAFSLRDTEDVIVIEVPWRKVRSAVRQILGWSYADDSPPWHLHRQEIPIQHPRYPWLWADSVNVQAKFPRGIPQPESNGGEPLVLAKMEAWSQYNSPTHEAYYATTELAIRFKPFPGRMYSDDDAAWTPGYEHRRFVGSVSIGPRQDQLTAEGTGGESAFYWADTSPDGPPAGGPNVGEKSGFRGGVFIRRVQTEYRMAWLNVEESYLVDTDQEDYWCAPYPRRLLSYLGKVNSSPIFGHAENTLLFTGVDITRYQQPVLTDSEWGLWAWDLVLTFQQFDPDNPVRPDGITTVPPGETPKRGHLLFPHRQSLGWYAITRSADRTKAGTYDGHFALEEADFFGIFKHVKDPS